MVLSYYEDDGCSNKRRVLRRGAAWTRKTLSMPTVVAAVFSPTLEVVTFPPDLPWEPERDNLSPPNCWFLKAAPGGSCVLCGNETHTRLGEEKDTG